ncbi:hypothetical protein BH09PAT3_BH09PAT3_6330 [soil metagenome]
MTLRQWNHLLTAVVVLLASYIILLPLLPAFSWWAQHQAPIISSPPNTSGVTPAIIPTENTLVIPSLDLQQTIYEGSNKYTLRKGVWHRPNSSTPILGGNTVLAGHRFTYHDPAVFYNLDKVSVGDKMVLYWEGKKYEYKVAKILTVPPTATEVEEPTSEPTLTVYTCTPLWSSKSRLVLVGTLVEKS